MYNLIEYSDDYSKTLGSLSQFYRGDTALTNAGPKLIFMMLITVLQSNLSKRQQVKQLIVVKDLGTIVPLKYLSTFLRTHGIPLINCEIMCYLMIQKEQHLQ